jgi:preprotein translocase subunit SecG
MNIFIGFLLVVHVLILIVLMQRPKSEGLGTAFGGGVADSLFGSGAGNVLTKITTWLGIIFFTTTISLALLYGKHGPKRDLSKTLKPAEAPVTTPATPSSSPILPTTPAPAPAPKAPEPAPAPKAPEATPAPAKPADEKPK